MSKDKKKLLENPIIGALVVPTAVVLVGASIVAGVTAMLNARPSYKDLVREMQSSTFGNRWVAALDLSKVISGGGIPPEEIPWLLEHLQDFYQKAQDPRTRNFIIVAVGALKNPQALPLLYQGLEDSDPGVCFRSITALADMPQKGLGNKDIEWMRVIPFLASSDILLQQGAVLALATHKVPEAEEEINKLLSHSNKNLRYSAALGLLNYQNIQRGLPVIEEILFSSMAKEHSALKLNILTMVAKNNRRELHSLIKKMEKVEPDLQVLSKAREVLKQFSKS